MNTILKNFYDEKITILGNSLDSLQANNYLKDNLDYVGSRLHGGIYALRHGKRSLILAVDNRALEIHKDTNLPVIPREATDGLAEIINSEWATEINLPQEAIDQFINQFKK